jgi:hypothetical protein
MIDYLLYVAREHPATPPSTDTPPANPVAVFRAVAANPDGITRHGLDAMMDVLFSAPAYEDYLKHPVEYQNEIANDLELSTLPTAFQAQWAHIIVPAWNHHSELRKVIDASRH